MKTILQVEDDPNDIFFFQRALAKVGWFGSLHVAKDGQQAIDYLNGEGPFADRGAFPFPDIILLDLKLPYVMGFEVLKWIRRQPLTSIVVIVLTASVEDADIAMAYDLGANAFLTKPVEAWKLEEMVKSVKDFWLTQNTLPMARLAKVPPLSAKRPAKKIGTAQKLHPNSNLATPNHSPSLEKELAFAHNGK
jgi:CheY-like chemotaxis protein